MADKFPRGDESEEEEDILTPEVTERYALAASITQGLWAIFAMFLSHSSRLLYRLYGLPQRPCRR